MSIDKEILRQVGHVLRPIATRVANSIARGVIQLVNDTKKMQLVQLGVLDGEDVEGAAGAEHFQPYGFASVPIVGAEGVVLFPNGDRAHPLVVVVADRRYRPIGGAPGTVMLHNHVDARVVLLPDGTIEARSAGGTATKLPTLADYNALRAAFNSHMHATAGTGPPVIPTPVAGVIPVPPPSGTTRLKAE